MIVGNKVVAAFERVAAHVIGDGESTIKQLIKSKNKSRRHNPGLRQFKIKRKSKTVLNMLKKNGYTIDSVPDKGKKIPLSIQTNIVDGGDSVDVTDKLTDEVKNLAIRAVKTIQTYT